MSAVKDYISTCLRQYSKGNAFLYQVKQVCRFARNIMFWFFRFVINEFHFTTQFKIQQYCEITIKEYLQDHIRVTSDERKGSEHKERLSLSVCFSSFLSHVSETWQVYWKEYLLNRKQFVAWEQSVSLYSVQTLPPFWGEQSRLSKTLAYNLEKSVKCKIMKKYLQKAKMSESEATWLVTNNNHNNNIGDTDEKRKYFMLQ